MRWWRRPTNCHVTMCILDLDLGTRVTSVGRPLTEGLFQGFFNKCFLLVEWNVSTCMLLVNCYTMLILFPYNV